MNQQDIVAVFQYAKDHPNFTIEDAEKELSVAGGTIRYLVGNENRVERYFRSYPGGENKPFTYVMTIEGHLFLLNYLNLEKARQSAKEARVIAIAALIVTIVVGLAQIIIG